MRERRRRGRRRRFRLGRERRRWRRRRRRFRLGRERAMEELRFAKKRGGSKQIGREGWREGWRKEVGRQGEREGKRYIAKVDCKNDPICNIYYKVHICRDKVHYNYNTTPITYITGRTKKYLT